MVEPVGVLNASWRRAQLLALGLHLGVGCAPARGVGEISPRESPSQSMQDESSTFDAFAAPASSVALPVSSEPVRTELQVEASGGGGDSGALPAVWIPNDVEALFLPPRTVARNAIRQRADHYELLQDEFNRLGGRYWGFAYYVIDGPALVFMDHRILFPSEEAAAAFVKVLQSSSPRFGGPERGNQRCRFGQDCVTRSWRQGSCYLNQDCVRTDIIFHVGPAAVLIWTQQRVPLRAKPRFGLADHAVWGQLAETGVRRWLESHPHE